MLSAGPRLLRSSPARSRTRSGSRQAALEMGQRITVGISEQLADQAADSFALSLDQ